MAYLKNSVIDYENRIVDNYSVEDYFTFDTKKVLDYVKTCTEDYFEWYQLENNDAIERVAHDLYGNADYWDILLLINGRDPLFGFVYDFDIVNLTSIQMVEKYDNDVYTTASLTDMHKQYMQQTYEKKLNDQNESNRLIKIVKPSRINEFLQKGYESGCFK